MAYLRQIFKNQIRDRVRSATRRPPPEPLAGEATSAEPSPLEEAIGREALAAYEAALDELPARQREAVVLRIELGFGHREVAEAVGCPSANAARMLVARALVSLAGRMNA